MSATVTRKPFTRITCLDTGINLKVEVEGDLQEADKVYEERVERLKAGGARFNGIYKRVQQGFVECHKTYTFDMSFDVAGEEMA